MFVWQHCPFSFPADYLHSIKAQHSAVALIKQQACAIAAESLADNIEETEGGATASSMASNTLSAAFMAWLVNSEKAQKVLDLIKIDNEKHALQVKTPWMWLL